MFHEMPLLQVYARSDTTRWAQSAQVVVVGALARGTRDVHCVIVRRDAQEIPADLEGHQALCFLVWQGNILPQLVLCTLVPTRLRRLGPLAILDGAF